MTSTEKTKSGSLVSKITYRLATPKDYNAVMDINRNIYDGFDYMPSLYMKFVKDPNHRVTVAELDGEVVAMANTYIMDGGKSLMGMAARVKTTHGNEGIWGDMRSQSDRADPMLKDVETFVAASARWDLHKMFWQRGKDYKLRMVQNFYKLTIDPDAMMWNIPPIVQRGLVCQSISSHEVLSVLENKDNQWKLFPHKKIVTLSTIAMKLMTSNFEAICKDIFNCVVTRDVSDADVTLCQSISLATTFPIAKGTRYSIDYYGHDLDDLYNHLCIHFRDIQRLSVHDGVHVVLRVPAHFTNADMTEKIVNRIDGLELSGEPFPLYFMELPFSQL